MATNQLNAGDTLTAGQQLISSNGKAHLVLQADGNLVLYRIDNGRALWASGTNGSGADHGIMQSDGNLVVYTAANEPKWSSGTFGHPGAYARLGDDGNLAVYGASGGALWASSTAQWDFTQSGVAAHALWGVGATAVPGSAYLATPRTPGWTYKARRDGAPWADAPFGWAKVPASGAAGLAMGTDTIIHVASMSKPVCATAIVAMLEDWRDLANGVAGSGPLAVPMTMTVFVQTFLGVVLPQTVFVPRWLAPALGNTPLLNQLLSAGLFNFVPQNLRSQVNSIASGQATIQPVVPPPPGYGGLLGKVLAGTPVPQYTDAFLPLIRARLQAKSAALGIVYSEGAHLANVTIDQLLKHQSTVRNGITDPSLATLIPASVTVQPSDGSRATCDLWAYLLAFARQQADAGPGYKNDDHNLLSGIVEACTGVSYDDYVSDRLLPASRFGALRRYVTSSASSANYYGGLGPWQTAGNPFPDYRGWGGSGGFYYTADQITDWLYVLYAGAPVPRNTLLGSSAPLVSSAGQALLFGTTAYFSAGARGSAGGGAWTTYVHNGGTGVGSGSCNGNMGIAVSPAGSIVTAFFCANGQIEATAPWNQALEDLIAHA